MGDLPDTNSSSLQAAIDGLIQKIRVMPASELAPECIILLSDSYYRPVSGEFRHAFWLQEEGVDHLTQFEVLRHKFSDAGLECPTIILWNVRSNDVTFQNKSDDK